MIRLSNGTLINRVQLGTGVIHATISPIDREMTEAEWNEYVPIVVESNRKHHRFAQLMRYCAMRESGRYYIPDDMPTLEAMREEMAAIELYFEAIEVQS